MQEQGSVVEPTPMSAAEKKLKSTPDEANFYAKVGD
jgi:hypothetical protein